MTDIQERIDPHLKPCGPCDYGLPMNCTCPKEDIRDVLLAAGDQIAELTRQRDDARRIAIEAGAFL